MKFRSPLGGEYNKTAITVEATIAMATQRCRSLSSGSRDSIIKAKKKGKELRTAIVSTAMRPATSRKLESELELEPESKVHVVSANMVRSIAPTEISQPATAAVLVMSRDSMVAILGVAGGGGGERGVEQVDEHGFQLFDVELTAVNLHHLTGFVDEDRCWHAGDPQAGLHGGLRIEHL